MRIAYHDYLRDFYGISKPISRQLHCLDITNTYLAYAVSREYVENVLPASAKQEVGLKLYSAKLDTTVTTTAYCNYC